jgi:hypothetical protein
LSFSVFSPQVATKTLLVGASGALSPPASATPGTTLTVVDLFPVLAAAAASEDNLDG